MIKVTKFVTSDGKQHDSIVEAKQHECYLASAMELTSILCSSLSTGRKEAVVGHMLIECDKIVDVIRKYKKSLPKQVKVS